jgi:hypothetical protein
MPENELTPAERVYQYISENRHDPLHFMDPAKDPYTLQNLALVEVVDTGTLKELVLSILLVSRTRTSANSDNIAETSPGRRRSSIDIWRHVLYFRPEVDILEIMRTLVDIVKTDRRVSTIFCGQVVRRVFRLYDKVPSTQNYDNEYMDEYNLHILDWEFIGMDY